MRVRGIATALALAAALAGCGLMPRNGVPVALMTEAAIPGLPGVRAVAGDFDGPIMTDLVQSFAQEARDDFPAGPDGTVRYPHLALSGGGPNGAFGTGLLVGWTESGKRPVFKIVTGISTGALMAPFAYLGESEDEALRRFYTTTSTGNVFLFRLRSVLPQLLAGEALADTSPLAALISENVDEAFLARIAAAHQRGRRLYIATVDLDSQQFVVWNMGYLAASGHPEALALFRKVMLAAASIPVAFPPVFFTVQAGGRRYDEMHVDGAVATRVFYSGGTFRFAEARRRAGPPAGREEVFVIHNGQLPPVPGETPRSVRGIAGRTMEASGKFGFLGDLFRIYTITQREGGEFRWITMPAGIELEGSMGFDPVRMLELYEVGRKLAMPAPGWKTQPPLFGTAEP